MHSLEKISKINFFPIKFFESMHLTGIFFHNVVLYVYFNNIKKLFKKKYFYYGKHWFKNLTKFTIW